MIKDRVIQKRIKGKVLAMAMTAVMASLFVPLGVEAAHNDVTIGASERSTIVLTEEYKWYVINKDGTEGALSTDTCLVDGECSGHKFIGSGPSQYAIKVAGGKHKITLKDVNTDLSTVEGNPRFSALDIAKDAEVDLTLEGNNTLTSARTRAGIAVPETAKLTIREAKDGGSLTVSSPYGGAGIGGDGVTDTSAAGSITIESGTINAKGSSGGAGIGGFEEGGAGTITINGGNVTAIGGDGSSTDADGELRTKGAPGIGSGSGGNVNSGTIAINVDNKQVKAWGGKAKNNGPQAYGISAFELTSQVGNSIEILSNGIDPLTNTNKFNGLIWTSATKDDKDVFSTGNVCIAYNQAIMPDKFNLLKNQTLSIYDPASVTIPSKLTGWTFYGTITGDGTLVNADKVTKEEGAVLKDTLTLKVILQSGDIKATTPSQVFTGTDLRSKVYTVAKTRKNESLNKTFEVDTNGWKITFKKGGVALPEPTDGTAVQIIDAGDYEVRYSKAGCADAVGTFKVLPRAISECKVVPQPLEDKVYIGRAYTSQDDFKFDLTYDGRTLKTTDYRWGLPEEKNKDVGKGEIQIKPSSTGNLEGDSLNVPYNIKPASLEKATVNIKFADSNKSFPYDGEEHKPTSVEVRLESIATDENPNGIVPESDYTVSYSRGDDFTSAGTITVTVTGKGNFTGAASADYEITRIQLNVTSITAESSRKYNGTTDVKITDLKVDLSNVREEDNKNEGDIVIDPSAITGTIGGPDVGTYNRVTLTNQHLSGKNGGNYSIDGTYAVDSNILTGEIEIIQRDAPALSLDGHYEVSQNDATKFTHTVTVAGNDPDKDVIDPACDVWFCMDAENPDVNDPTVWSVKGQWVALDPEKPEALTPIGVFDGIEPGSTHTFYAYTDGTRNVAKSTSPGQYTEDFEKLLQDPPEACELTISETPNADGETFTATVTPVEEGRYLYSFDGGATYGPSNTFEGCLPGTKYVAYIKYAETATHKESEGTASAEVTTKKLTAKSPIIELATGGTTFLGRANVVLTYPTNMPGMKIYYTTNGSVPTESSTLYTDQFSISDTTTVQAIAVSDTLDKSEPASASFEKTGDTEVQSVAELKVGLTDNQIQSLLGKRLDEDTIVENHETVEAFMTALLSAIPGYVNQNVKVYDLTIRIAIYDENGKIIDWVTPQEEDFPIKINLTYEQLQLPEGVSGATHDFVVTHMFTKEMRNHMPGETEEPSVEKTDKGISFYVDGASPLAVAWKEASSGNEPTNPDDPNNPNNPDDPNNPDNPDDPNNPDNPDDPNNPDNPDDPNNPDNPDPNANGDGTGNQNGDGTNGNGTTSSTNAAEQGASDDSKNALSNLMPKTGDPISFIPWIAAAVVSIGVIVGIVKKKKGKKKKPNKTTKKTTQKSTQKTKKKK